MSHALTAGQRALLQTALEQQIAQQLEGRTRPEHARDVLLQDGDDAPARDADREIDLARSDLEIGELRAVNDALERLASEHYGLCGDCEAAIPFDRLQRHPEVLRCVACQTAHEARSGQTLQRATI